MISNLLKNHRNVFACRMDAAAYVGHNKFDESGSVQIKISHQNGNVGGNSKSNKMNKISLIFFMDMMAIKLNGSILLESEFN